MDNRNASDAGNAWACRECGQTEFVWDSTAAPALCTNCGADDFVAGANDTGKVASRVAPTDADVIRDQLPDEIAFYRAILTAIATRDTGPAAISAKNALAMGTRLYRNSNKGRAA